MKCKIINNSSYLLFGDGTLKNLKTNKIIKWILHKRGYLVANIKINGKYKLIYKHRAIAECFVKNKLNKKEVNHINGIKTDNRIENLEWVTTSENQKHSYILGKKIRGKHKKVIDSSNNFIYKNISQAARSLNISQSHLSNMLHGKDINKTTLKFYGK